MGPYGANRGGHDNEINWDASFAASLSKILGRRKDILTTHYVWLLGDYDLPRMAPKKYFAFFVSSK